MPIISLFFGIVIRMFHREHNPPHFHASYQGFEILIRIEDGTILRGSLPPRALKIVVEWSERHRAELLDNWRRGVEMLPMEMVVGADADD